MFFNFVVGRFHMTQSQASANWSVGPISNIIATPLVSLLFARCKQPTIIGFGNIFCAASVFVVCTICLEYCMLVWATMGAVCFAHLYLAFAPRSWPVIPALMVIGFAYK
jgi:hypothetical protein